MEIVFAYILTTDKAIIMKLHRNINQVKYYITVYNQGTKRAWPRSSDPLLYFGTPLYISEMAKARNLKFGVQIDCNEYYPKHANLGDNRAWHRSRDLLLNFGTPSISQERLKLET